jgi:hypothetical protein
MLYCKLSIAQKVFSGQPSNRLSIETLTRFLFVHTLLARRSDCCPQSLQKAGQGEHYT